jgi:Domain of unknown function (DUF5071)
MAVDPRSLLPRHKSDGERVRALVDLGYPAVAPVLPELLTWMQDGNWPVSFGIGPFLAAIGEPVVPLVREVFAGTDGIWKYWCIERIVRAFPPDVAEQLRSDLERLARHPTPNDQSEEVDERAHEALAWLDGRETAGIEASGLP